MAVNQHIQELAIDIGLSKQQQECLQCLWDNRNEMNLITLSAVNESSTGAGKDLKAGFVYRGGFVRLTKLIAKVTGRKTSPITHGVIVDEDTDEPGFVLLDSFYSRLTPKKSRLRAKTFQAVQTYMEL